MTLDNLDAADRPMLLSIIARQGQQIAELTERSTVLENALKRSERSVTVSGGRDNAQQILSRALLVQRQELWERLSRYEEEARAINLDDDLAAKIVELTS